MRLNDLLQFLGEYIRLVIAYALGQRDGRLGVTLAEERADREAAERRIEVERSLRGLPDDELRERVRETQRELRSRSSH